MLSVRLRWPANKKMVRIHLGHLVGGRARSYTDPLPYERILQADVPEQPGALRKVLGVLSPDFLITLFHYRKTGGHGTWYPHNSGTACTTIAPCIIPKADGCFWSVEHTPLVV